MEEVTLNKIVDDETGGVEDPPQEVQLEQALNQDQVQAVGQEQVNDESRDQEHCQVQQVQVNNDPGQAQDNPQDENRNSETEEENHQETAEVSPRKVVQVQDQTSEQARQDKQIQEDKIIDDTQKDNVEKEDDGPANKLARVEANPPVSLYFLRRQPDAQPRLLASATTSFKPHYLDAARGAPAYLKGCKFSPDGLCVLTCSSDDNLRIFEIPKDGSETSWDACVTMKEGETVYDFCWHPKMDSGCFETSCLLSSAQYQPIHLYDAYDGRVRATYRCFNHLDEMVAANSVTFDQSGRKIYAGLKHEVRIFDVSLPGRDFLESRTTWTKKEGGLQPGIVSCIAPNPYLSSVYAVGTYGKTVGVYLEPRGQALCLLEGQRGGVTHAQFTPDGSKLLVGGRRDPEVLVWDMRNPGQLYATLRREAETNQRIYFDVHPSNSRWVVGGTTGGSVHIWDLLKPPDAQSDSEGVSVLDPIWSSSELHTDCVNGATFHPSEPIFVTSSGQRHVTVCQDSSDEDDEQELIDGKTRPECSLKLWKFQNVIG